MPPDTGNTLVTAIWGLGTTGLVAFMFFIIWGFISGKIVRGSEVQEWKQLALQDRHFAGKGLEISKNILREEVSHSDDRSKVEQLEKVIDWMLAEQRKQELKGKQ